MQWGLITDIILASAFVVVAVFACLALCQWIKRRSFTKIDLELRLASIPLILMAITYFIFDHFLIWNTRPNGSGEPSFPSSHVMFVATVFAITAIVLPVYVKSRFARSIIYLLMLVLVVFVAVGRVLANMHWISDVIGALIFSAIFAAIYYLIIWRCRQTKSPTKTKKRSHHA